jgi:hypothetical protein
MPKRETRSPLKEVPLRYPGQSLDDEIIDIRDDVFFYITFATSYVACAISIWIGYLVKRLDSIPPLMTAISLFFIVVTAYKWIQGRKKITLLKMARDGERIVGEQLELLREKGYAIFHDIQADKFNIDHVVISKHGVFVIETKTFSKPVKGDAKVIYDGEKVNVNGWEPDRDPIKQAKANASWLKDILKKSTGNVYPVKGAVIFPGWYVESKSPKSEVWVLNPKALPTFIGNEPECVTQTDVNMIAFHLSRYIRSPLSK